MRLDASTQQQYRHRCHVQFLAHCIGHTDAPVDCCVSHKEESSKQSSTQLPFLQNARRKRQATTTSITTTTITGEQKKKWQHTFSSRCAVTSRALQAHKFIVVLLFPTMAE